MEDLTGFPECLDGRVKTLHPRVHAGLLADLANPDHERQLDELGIAPFQLLVSNLYPFEQTVASGATPPEIIEQIDIGGPAMVRAAAKNHGSVAVVTSPAQYGDVIKALADGGFDRARAPPAGRRRVRAHRRLRRGRRVLVRRQLRAGRGRGADRLARPHRPGVDPGRRAPLRREPAPARRLYEARSAAPGADPGIANAEVLHGKAMSYNNYVDADSARRAAYDFAQPCVAIIKHSNPCGIAIGANIAAAHAKALACDPLSAYGGVVAANSAVTDAMAEQITDGFAEVVIAPDFDPAAVEILTAKWKNIRLLRCDPPPWGAAAGPTVKPRSVRHPPILNFGRSAAGCSRRRGTGSTRRATTRRGWELKAGAAADAATLADLAFAWRACRAVKSNAILLAAGGASVGVGMGQVNRVDSARLAVARAGNRAAGSVAASDAFFPFPDGFEILAEAGVRAVVEPGGSIRDDGVIAAAQAAGVTLYFTGVRHFYH